MSEELIFEEIDNAPLILKPSEISTTALDEKTKEVAQQLLDSNNLDECKDLVNLFNLNLQKRSAVRALKMNELLDKVTANIEGRLDRHPDNFTSEELMKYMQVIEGSVDRASKNLNLAQEVPAIQVLTQNNVQINMENRLDKDSRERVLDAVNAILKQAQSNNEIVVENTEES